MTKTKITATLEQWYAVHHPSLDEYIIYGDIHGDVHGRWPDGQYIHTSGISKGRHPISKLKKGSVVHTRNSVYKLGVKSNYGN